MSSSCAASAALLPSLASAASASFNGAMSGSLTQLTVLDTPSPSTPRMPAAAHRRANAIGLPAMPHRPTSVRCAPCRVSRKENDAVVADGLETNRNVGALRCDILLTGEEDR